MKTYQTDQVKSIALLGNSGSGKTTLAEAMLLMAVLLNEEEPSTGKTPHRITAPLNMKTVTRYIQQCFTLKYRTKK